jgi:hypothetical protein
MPRRLPRVGSNSRQADIPDKHQGYKLAYKRQAQCLPLSILFHKCEYPRHDLLCVYSLEKVVRQSKA